MSCNVENIETLLAAIAVVIMIGVCAWIEMGELTDWIKGE